jgi:hypothetical protein
VHEPNGQACPIRLAMQRIRHDVASTCALYPKGLTSKCSYPPHSSHILTATDAGTGVLGLRRVRVQEAQSRDGVRI